jgi:glycosyltransferase involved in cell wall biosynthesis
MSQADIGILEPRIRFIGREAEHDRLWEAGSIADSAGRLHTYGHLENAEIREFCYRKEVDAIAPYCYVVDIAALKACETSCSLDARLGLRYGFADLCMKMRSSGYKTVYQPLANIVSFDDPKQDSFKLKLRANSRHQARFASRWSTVLKAEGAASTNELYVCSNRSKNKSCVLVIDDKLPNFDTNAGDRMLFQMMEVFVALDLNVKFMGADHELLKAYADPLERKGIELVGFDGGGDAELSSFLGAHGSAIDYAVISRPGNAMRYLHLIKKETTAKVIYNLVDLHHLRMQRELELGNQPYSAEDVRQLKRNELAIIASAQQTITPSAYEAALLSKEPGAGKITTVPIFIYDQFPKINARFEDKEGLLFVGGFLHKPNVDAMLWFCEQILPKIIESLPDVQLYIAGADMPRAVLALEGKNVTIKGRLSDEELAELYEHCRLAVIPLRYGAGVKGKLVEALHRGLPVISTSIGTEGLPEITDCIKNTDDASAFADKVIELYGDSERLALMAKRNQQYAREHFSLERAKLIYAEIFALDAAGVAAQEAQEAQEAQAQAARAAHQDFPFTEN